MKPQLIIEPVYQSETSKHRDKILKYCTGYGCDIGFGGDPITDSAIRIDFATPYAVTGKASVQLGGDCRNLKWFRNNVLDYVYSSHVLEDFPEDETVNVIREWIRVLKKGGKLILLLPDQQRYLAHCRKNNETPNEHHAIDHFSAKYICDVAAKISELSLVECNDDLGDYSFFAVFEKKIASTQESESHLINSLDMALKRLAERELELSKCEARLNFVHNHPLIRPFVWGRRMVQAVFGKSQNNR